MQITCSTYSSSQGEEKIGKRSSAGVTLTHDLLAVSGITEEEKEMCCSMISDGSLDIMSHSLAGGSSADKQAPGEIYNVANSFPFKLITAAGI